MFNGLKKVLNEPELKYVFLNEVLKYHVLGLKLVKNEGF
jgi:hypothetical protein